MLSHETPTKVLVIDIGGTHIKVYAKGRRLPKIDSGPDTTPKKMIKAVHTALDGWRYEVVSVGYPGPVVHGKPVSNPVNLGPGIGLDLIFTSHSGIPRKSSMMRHCRRSAVIAADACFSSVWAPVWDRR